VAEALEATDDVAFESLRQRFDVAFESLRQHIATEIIIFLMIIFDGFVDVAATVAEFCATVAEALEATESAAFTVTVAFYQLAK